MRLAAQMKGGFYPAHEGVIAQAARFLRRPHQQSFAICDPCAGEGAAIRQFGDLLGCPRSMTYAIELDEERAESLHAALPDAHVLAPANFFGCRAGWNCFSFLWLNPPFDDAYDGHRVEKRFLTRATELLMPRGVMAFVCPENVIDEYSDARQHFITYYDFCQIVPFPAQHRRFEEVIVFGRKRAKPLAEDKDKRPSWESIQAAPGYVYDIPPGTGPRVFMKIEPTEPELAQMLAESPLRSHLTIAPQTAIPSPPLALGIGHVALLLASGQLNGVVQPDGQAPHVVRGTSRKSEFVSNEEEIENADGTTSTRTTMSERIELVVRTVDLSGKIQTFMDGNAAEANKPVPKSGAK